MDLGTLGLDVPQLFLSLPSAGEGRRLSGEGLLPLPWPAFFFLLCFLESLDLSTCALLFYSHGTCRGFFFFTLNLPGERLFIFVEVALKLRSPSKSA